MHSRRALRRSLAQKATVVPPPVTTGLLADFDASTGVVGTSAVSSWTSREGVVLTQANGAQQPSTGTLNGYPAISFANTAGQHLAGATLATALDGADTFTVYHIGQLATLAGGNKTPWGSSNTNDQYNYALFQGTNGNDGLVRGDPTQTATLSTSSPGTAVYDHVASYDGANATTYINGAAAASGANARAPTCTMFSVGTLLLSGTTSQTYQGVIGRLLVFNTVHDASQRLAVRTWLRARFGL